MSKQGRKALQEHYTNHLADWARREMRQPGGRDRAAVADSVRAYAWGMLSIAVHPDNGSAPERADRASALVLAVDFVVIQTYAGTYDATGVDALAAALPPPPTA